MSSCSCCGFQMESDAGFCPKCGCPKIDIPFYTGIQREFPFMGHTLVISSGMDVFNHYRKIFHDYAGQITRVLSREYFRSITCFDFFVLYFNSMYCRYRKPLLDAVANLLPQAGIYDVSLQTFEAQHTAEHCSCYNDMVQLLNCYNATIAVNRHHRGPIYGLPGLISRGANEFTSAMASNYAVNNTIAINLQNAKITPEQKMELFCRINPQLLMEHVTQDFGNISQSLCKLMSQRGLDVWCPTPESIQKAEGLFENISLSKIPENQAPDFIITLLQTNPYNVQYFKYISWKYGNTPEIGAINRYFGFDGAGM